VAGSCDCSGIQPANVQSEFGPRFCLAVSASRSCYARLSDGLRKKVDGLINASGPLTIINEVFVELCKVRSVTVDGVVLHAVHSC